MPSESVLLAGRPDGQQLPYIDRVNFSIAQDVESLMLDALSGKLDIQERHIDTLQNKPTLSQNMQKAAIG
jgi:peptide/nickel transport system substrate-binding protein